MVAQTGTAGKRGFVIRCSRIQRRCGRSWMLLPGAALSESPRAFAELASAHLLLPNWTRIRRPATEREPLLRSSTGSRLAAATRRRPGPRDARSYPAEAADGGAGRARKRNAAVARGRRGDLIEELECALAEYTRQSRTGLPFLHDADEHGFEVISQIEHKMFFVREVIIESLLRHLRRFRDVDYADAFVATICETVVLRRPRSFLAYALSCGCADHPHSEQVQAFSMARFSDRGDPCEWRLAWCTAAARAVDSGNAAKFGQTDDPSGTSSTRKYHCADLKKRAFQWNSSSRHDDHLPDRSSRFDIASGRSWHRCPDAPQ